MTPSVAMHSQIAVDTIGVYSVFSFRRATMVLLEEQWPSLSSSSRQ